MENLRYLPGVSTLGIDTDRCTGCGICTLVCPHGIFEINGKKAEIIDIDGCMECGACTLNCPVEALSVTPGVGCAAYIIQTCLHKKGVTDCGIAKCC